MEKETKFEVVLETLALFSLLGCVLALGFWADIVVSGILYVSGYFLHLIVLWSKDLRKAKWERINDDVLDSNLFEKNA